jgi:MFS-type transporter involved in bile tolerance (Atg22 family)
MNRYFLTAICLLSSIVLTLLAFGVLTGVDINLAEPTIKFGLPIASLIGAGGCLMLAKEHFKK